ncbi:MAG: SH3 domain-containing protein [Bdellovibrionales bacterium]|nr:SH3 domain-containing protein [Massilia sp.]
MFNISYLAIAAVVIGLVLTLVLAAFLTPAHWWRQLNARALAVVFLGTWGIASLVIWLAHGHSPQAIAHSAAPATAGVAPIAAFRPETGRSYRVHEDLNLRSAKGTGAPRIAVVPAGSVVTTTGVRDGDWWQVNARIAGRDVQGWSSSLWLRRADESRL